MVNINVGQTKLGNGENMDRPERLFLDEDSYEAEVYSIGKIFQAQFKQGDKITTTNKIPIEFKVIEGSKEYLIPMYPTTTITEAKEGRSSSKMYDLLLTAKLLDKCLKESELWKSFEEPGKKEKIDDAFTKFLNDNILKRKCKVMLKTVKKGQPDKYSVVDRVLKFY